MNSLFANVEVSISRLSQRVDDWCLSLEGKCGRVLASFMVGTLVIGLSCLYVMPRFTVTNHGVLYMELSQHPFDFARGNPLQFRILIPLLSYILHVPARVYPFVPIVFLILLMAAIFRYYRVKTSPTEALLFVLIVAFSTTVFIPLIAPGYVDAPLYFFAWMCFVMVHRPGWLLLFLMASVFTHEAALFLFPAIFAFAIVRNDRGMRGILMLVLVFAFTLMTYAVYRSYVTANVHVVFDSSYYTSLPNVLRNVRLVARLAPAGAFFSFKSLWFLVFVCVVATAMRREYRVLLPVVLIVLGVTAQLLFAYDITRLFGLAFVAILLSAEYLRDALQEKFVVTLTALIVLNLCVPQYFVSQEGLNDLFSPIIYLFEYAVDVSL